MATFPAGVKVKKADLESVSSLTKAFEGQDAVVSTVATGAALGGQKPIVDAVVAAKVSRFIPSEFGYDTTELGESTLATMLNGKTQLLEYVKQQAEKNSWLTWTGIATGLFFDWGLDAGTFGINLSAKTATIFDSGNEPVTPSSLPFVGRVVVAVLSRPEQTANKYLKVASFTTTQNELLKVFEEETGASFTVTRASTSDVEKTAHEKLAKGDHSAFVDLLFFWTYRDGHGHAIKGEGNANKLLGLTDEDVRAVVKKYISDKKAA